MESILALVKWMIAYENIKRFGNVLSSETENLTSDWDWESLGCSNQTLRWKNQKAYSQKFDNGRACNHIHYSDYDITNWEINQWVALWNCIKSDVVVHGKVPTNRQPNLSWA